MAAPFQTGPQAASLFETPVIVDQLPDADELNRELKQAILARRDTDPGVQVSNVHGWHSDRAMLRWGGAAAGRLRDRIVADADRFTADVGSEGKPRYRWFPEMWANVSSQGAANQYHSHPGAFWSAVYYVEDGYAGDPDPKLGGELVLLDPRMPAVAMNAPDLRFRRPGETPQAREKWMRPESGRLVIFPSWLLHAVNPYRGNGLRISIAVNLSAVPLSVPAEPADPRSNP